jgi:CheY-like chemotaxis protein
MSKTVNCILLVDDNPDDNFFHEKIIRKHGVANTVVAKQSGQAALNYLMARDEHPDAHPDIIFLDINMPGMNGWEFLDAYRELPGELQCQVVVVMLTTSENPADKAKAAKYNIISDFKSKPLTKTMLDEIMAHYF